MQGHSIVSGRSPLRLEVICNQPAAQRIPPVHCQALEGQYGSVEAGNLSWDLSDVWWPGVMRCHHLVSFMVQVRKLCHSMTLAFSIIFPWCPSVNFCGMHLNLEGLTSTPLRVFCMPFRAMELWTFKPSSMKWWEAGQVMDVYNSEFGQRIHLMTSPL